MKPWITSSSPRHRRLGAPRGLVWLAMLLLLPALQACVSSGTYHQAVQDRDAWKEQAKQLAERNRLLNASNASLSGERNKLVGQVEDLREQHDSLEKSVSDLTQMRDQLKSELAARESELAKRQAEMKDMRQTYDGLVSDLQTQVAEGQVQIEQLRSGLRVKLSQAILFPTGSAELGGEGKQLLAKVASRLAGLPNRIEVDGFTDNVPITGALKRTYPSNWELAGARAARVVRILEEKGVPADRLSAVSHGETDPVASNDTAQGRARNRRIEIRLVPLSEGEAPESGGKPAASAPAKKGSPPG